MKTVQIQHTVVLNDQSTINNVSTWRIFHKTTASLVQIECGLGVWIDEIKLFLRAHVELLWECFESRPIRVNSQGAAKHATS